VYASTAGAPAPGADLAVADLGRPVDPPRRQLGRGVLALWRPGQWPKNVLVVSIPLIDLTGWNLAVLWRVFLAVVAFTVASTVVYAVNDIADRERDRNHPTKRLRAVASGWVPVPVAAACAVAQAGLLAAILATRPAVWCLPILGYLVLSVAYSLKLKHLPILDVFAIATGFVLRLQMGYLATGGAASGWLLVSVFSLCLLLTLGKRRHELSAFGAAHRPALRGYTVELADRLMMLSGVLTAVAYLLYLRLEAPLGSYAGPAMLASTPFALFGLFRYLQVVEVDRGGEDPVRTLVRDRAMVVNSALWLLQAAAFLVAAHGVG